jgi:hypothetical protein
MRRLLHSLCATALALAALPALAQRAAQVSDVPAADYLRLLHASRNVEQFKQVAAVSARVYGARDKGTDKEYAQLMGVIATADLSDANDCLVNLYRSQELTREDVAELISIFESPLGVKLLEHSERMLLAAIERGGSQPMQPAAFSDDEKRGLQEIRENAAFRKYGAVTANQRFATGMIDCIGQSEAVKKTGIKY